MEAITTKMTYGNAGAYQSLSPPNRERLISEECMANHPMSVFQTDAFARAVSDEFCREHRHEGMTHAQFVECLCRFYQRRMGRRPCQFTLTKYQNQLEAAGVIRIVRVGLKGSRILRVEAVGVLELNGGRQGHEAAAEGRRVDDRLRAQRRRLAVKAARAVTLVRPLPTFKTVIVTSGSPPDGRCPEMPILAKPTASRKTSRVIEANTPDETGQSPPAKGGLVPPLVAPSPRQPTVVSGPISPLK